MGKGLSGLIDRYPVTIGVIGACLVLFLFTLTQPEHTQSEAVRPFANASWLVLREPWRLITCAFLHYGPIHFLFNAYALWVVGRLLEIHYGSARLWVLFVLFALAGSVTAVSWEFLAAKARLDVGVSYRAGASGGIMGLICMGYVYARGASHRLGSIARQLQQWLVICLVFTFLVPGIDIAGHLGGAAAGAAAGYFVRPKPGDDEHKAWRPAAIGMALLCLACFGAAVWTLRQG